MRSVYIVLRRSVMLTIESVEEKVLFGSIESLQEHFPDKFNTGAPETEDLLFRAHLAYERRWDHAEAVNHIYAAAARYDVGTFGLKEDGEDETDDEKVIDRIGRVSATTALFHVCHTFADSPC